MELIGSWVKCPNPIMTKVEHWWKKFPNYKYSYCDLCVQQLKDKNNKMYGATIKTHSYINHLTECKPEKDTL